MLRYLMLVAFLYLPSGCSGAGSFLDGFTDGYERGAAARSDGRSSGVVSRSTGKLMLFGGRGHDVYLGCLSCSEYESDSVFNEYGEYGSKYGDMIRNPYSDYGSRYSSYSVCNPYASDPPVIVDDAGTFYGRLSLNRSYTSDIMTSEMMGWFEAMCEA